MIEAGEYDKITELARTYIEKYSNRVQPIFSFCPISSQDFLYLNCEFRYNEGK